MEKGVKITLIVCGGAVALTGVGFLIYKLTNKNQSLISGTSDTLLGQTKNGYTYVDCGKSGTDIKKGEDIYALKDATIVFRDNTKNGGNKYQKDYKRGDKISVAYDVTANRIRAFENGLLTTNKNQRWIERGSSNQGKLGVLRDKNGNPVSVEDVSKIDWGNLIEFGTQAINTYSNVSSTIANAKTNKDASKTGANGEKLVVNSLNKVVE